MREKEIANFRVSRGRTMTRSYRDLWSIHTLVCLLFHVSFDYVFMFIPTATYIWLVYLIWKKLTYFEMMRSRNLTTFKYIYEYCQRQFELQEFNLPKMLFTSLDMSCTFIERIQDIFMTLAISHTAAYKMHGEK